MEMPQRLDKLEKERWLYLGVAGLGGIAGLLVVLVGVMKGGSVGGNVVTVRDAKNNVRIEMGLDKTGLPQIVFRDQKNKVRQSIGMTAEGDPNIQLRNSDGLCKPR